MTKMSDFISSLGARPVGQFKPTPYICPETGSVTVYFEDCPSYGVWVNKHLTLFKSFQDETIVGIQLSVVASNAN